VIQAKLKDKAMALQSSNPEKFDDVQELKKEIRTRFEHTQNKRLYSRSLIR
jgi:hypothetical protein